MRSPILLCALALSACGVADVGTTAATTAKLEAAQAQQGKETMDKVRTDLDAAAKADQQRLNAAAAQQ
jgi:hypothetical protein